MKELEDKSIIAWVLGNQIKNERGEPIDFSNHAFLFDIYTDFSPKMVCLKAAQIGYTTLQTLKSFWVGYHRKMDQIYTLPTAHDIHDFVGGKVNRIIQANPVLQKYVEDRDTIEQKRVGQNVIYYRGTFTEKAALMVSSDWNSYDEEDRSDQKVIQQYASRLQHSKYGWEHHFSNPSAEGAGVSRYWPTSDQKHWFITCSRCSYEQFLMWPDSIDQERQCFICKKCKEELSLNDRRVGRWVPKFRDGREYSGYWISLLMAPWITASEIIKLSKEKSQEYFWNFVLGLPYVGEGNKLTPSIFYQNLHRVVQPKQRLVIGCDSGIIKHFVIGNQYGLQRFGKTETWDDIRSLLDQNPESIAVIDAMPDITGPRELQDEYPGRVFLCFYAKDRKTQQLIRWGKHEETGRVIADRNRVIQMVIDDFAARRIPVYGTRDDWDEYYSHWDTLYRVMTEDKVTHSPTFEWLSSTGLDHYAHATSYWRIGMDKYGFGGGDILNLEDNLLAPVVPTLKPDLTIQPVTQRGEDVVTAALASLRDTPDDWRD